MLQSSWTCGQGRKVLYGLTAEGQPSTLPVGDDGELSGRQGPRELVSEPAKKRSEWLDRRKADSLGRAEGQHPMNDEEANEVKRPRK